MVMTYVRNITYGKDMPVSRLTSKGQTTIPKEIRDKLDLKPGDRIRFVFEEDDRVLLEPIKADLSSLAGMLYDPNRKALTNEEINDAIAQAAVERYLRSK